MAFHNTNTATNTIVPPTTTKIIAFITVAIMDTLARDPIANTDTHTHIIGFEILNPDSIASPTLSRISRSDDAMNVMTITKKNGENRLFAEETRGKTKEKEKKSIHSSGKVQSSEGLGMPTTPLLKDADVVNGLMGS
ncbi:hypothetical protein ACLOJK_007524 [Asimina triloba]